MNKEEVIFTIMGVTGDLSKRKIIPSIYELVKENELENFRIIGVSRGEEKINKIIEESKDFIGNEEIENKTIEKIKEKSTFCSVNFKNKEDFNKLKKCLKQNREESNIDNQIFYLATLPKLFNSITENLGSKNIGEGNKGYTQIVYEKPFGNNKEQAKKINKTIKKYFDEDQIFRVDHFLNKELVENITLTRFTNRILEPLWSKEHVGSVELIVDESVGVKNRSEFYDRHGALEDLVQNHMMQMLALTAMEAPQKLTSDYIKDKKSKVLEKVEIKDVVLGQYEDYTNLEGVKENSNTETFAAIDLRINNERWKDIPFYLRTGKKLKEKKTQIRINFKQAECLLTKTCPSEPNHLDINIYPEDKIKLNVNVKVPGQNNVTPAPLEFSHSEMIDSESKYSPYVKMIKSVMKKDTSISVRDDEIEKQWSIIEQINKDELEVYEYEQSSNGPEKANKIIN